MKPRKASHTTTKNSKPKPKMTKLPQNHRYFHLQNVGNMTEQITGKKYIFAPERIYADERLYELYKIPNDDIMKSVLKDFVEEFLEAFDYGMSKKSFPFLGNIQVDDYVKLGVFMDYFDGCMNDGVIMEQYNQSKEMENSLIEIFKAAS
jgi:hypothetical protein